MVILSAKLTFYLTVHLPVDRVNKLTAVLRCDLVEFLCCLFIYLFVLIVDFRYDFFYTLAMKIFCEISVYNRMAPHVKPRSQQSTLAIGYHPPNATKIAENLFLIHFTTINKAGTRYKLNRNIEKVFTKFVNDGKTTISLKQPPHDLQIRCDPIQLKAFLQTFKNALEGKLDPTKPGLSTLAVTGVPKNAVPIKSMTIQTPSDYPVKGLPRTLTTLNVIMLQLSNE